MTKVAKMRVVQNYIICIHCTFNVFFNVDRMPLAFIYMYIWAIHNFFNSIKFYSGVKELNSLKAVLF